MKAKSGEPTRFLSEWKANDAAVRARLLGDFLRKSMVSDMPSISQFVNRGVFTIKAVERKERKKSHAIEAELF